MSKIKYFELIDEFCLLCGMVQPRVQPGTISDGDAFYVNDVRFSLVHNDAIDATSLFAYADFGALPPGSELPAMKGLLEANLYLYGSSVTAPAFAISEETGHVVMAQQSKLAEMDGQSLSVLLVAMAAKGRQWREDYFLNPQTNPFQLAAP